MFVLYDYCGDKMKEIMKKIFKGVFIPVVVSVMLGFVCGKFVYKTYQDSIYGDLNSSKLYLVENGKYLTYDSMREENSGNNYVYYKDDDGYKTVIGITRDEENIEKIKSLYSDEVNVEEYYVPTEFFDEKQDEYDLLLANADDIYEVKEVVDNILNLYRSDDSIRLVSIN